MSSHLSVQAAELPQVTGENERISAHRIISAGGGITEILYALGAGQQLVGTDTTSSYPEAATKLPSVGYQRNLSAEGILSLAPDLLLISPVAGPPTVLKQISAAGIPVKTIEEDYSKEGLIKKIRHIAALVDKQNQSEPLLARLSEDFDTLEKTRGHSDRRPRILFLLTVSQGNLLAAGSDTPADAMIQLAGGSNAMNSFTSYKPLSTEALITAAPDIILCTDLTLNSVGGLENLLNRPGIKLTPAGHKDRVIVMDTLFLLGFGPRTGQAALDLSRQIQSFSVLKSGL
ncbi:ABC transporter substrate-binding protein [Methylicorpusculum oleiharenae]|uniref:heme/hemin ABC transporter substrate-binding protein n=1 Tax=Methylicorpusculum oleiharenae TaxID=1338687 RepID=UPI001E29A9A1|nr:ABC transporter substrate-binding protein [Methylicorpusculum oleiharenae]MCD2449887.1 ABC transporter substrate-binding protein [Methylicorpusculum oleiharenae]